MVLGTALHPAAWGALALSWFQEPTRRAESETRGRFESSWPVRRRPHVEYVELFDIGWVSWFQEPLRIPSGGTSLVVSGTARTRRTPANVSWFQEPAGSWFQEPAVSWFQEPVGSWDWEPSNTWFQEPCFVVSGTKARGNRNRAASVPVVFQRLGRISTAFNRLTSLSNRVYFNAARAETPCPSAASWGLRPRRLAPPLRGCAPGANAPSHPASPKRRRATPDRLLVVPKPKRGSRPTNVVTAADAEEGLSEESLAFSAGDHRNPEWAASTAKRRAFPR